MGLGHPVGRFHKDRAISKALYNYDFVKGPSNIGMFQGPYTNRILLRALRI